MAWYEDLTACDYFHDESNLTAVGWLESGRPFTQGATPKRFISRLNKLLDAAWQPMRFRGIHDCDLCLFSKSRKERIAGHLNLFIPWETKVLVAPELIRHYIEAHRYQPPREFQEAVMACPSMGSREYFDSLRFRSALFREAVQRARAGSP